MPRPKKGEAKAAVNFRKPWGPVDDMALRVAVIVGGMLIAEIAPLLGRSRNAIGLRLHKIGLRANLPSGFPSGVLLDSEDALELGHHKWYIDSSHGYICRGSYKEYLHRRILGAKEGECVDHINGNVLDNRRCNLRLVTRAENAANRHKTNNRYGMRGVTKFPGGRTKPWLARCTVNGKRYRIGYFKTANEAAHAAKEFRLANMPGATS